MYIFIDARTGMHENPHILWYAKFWWKLWQEFHQNDELVYLVSHHTDMENESYIVLPPDTLFANKIPLRQKQIGNMLFRTMSFSPLPLYDTSMPAISHIWWLGNFLYNLPYRFWGKTRENFFFRRKLSRSTQILVPHIGVGRDIADMFHISEKKIGIMNLLTDNSLMCRDFREPLVSFDGKYCIYDGGYGYESRIEELIYEWSKYADTTEEPVYLLLLGHAGERLTDVLSTIRAFDTKGIIKYMGYPSREELDSLYHHASGWVYAGNYFSAYPALAYACSHGIPLLLPALDVLLWYKAFHFSVNHIDTLHSYIEALIRTQKTEQKSYDTKAYMEAYKNLLSKK